MKKRIIKNIIKVVGFCLVLALVFNFLNSFLDYVDPINTASVKGLKTEPTDSLDVVVLGASEVYADYSAVLAYEKYGYTSYSFAVTGIPGTVYKSMIREVMATQNPKVLVIEINGFLQKDWYYDRVMELKGWIDSIDDKERRELAIKEAISEENMELFEGNSFAANHNNWQIPFKCASSYYGKVRSVFQSESQLKGFSNHARINYNKGMVKDKYLHFTDKSKACYEDLLNFCKEMGFENVVFTRFPHERESKNPEVFDEFKEMTEAYGYPFVNFEAVQKEIGIDNDKDFYNVEHLNIFGAQKFTDYLANYLVTNYDLSNMKHSDEVTAQWDSCIPVFHEYEKKLEKNTLENVGGVYFEYRR